MRSLAILALVLAAATLTLAQQFGPAPATERAALVSFYTFTGGAQWTTSTNWNVGDPCINQWYGVTCQNNTANTGANVIRLRLVNNNLRGSVPGVLSSLTMLQSLNLNTNHLTGGIPPTFTTLDQLTYLDLGYNFLTFGLNVLGQMGTLQTIYLNNNSIAGTLSFLPQIPSLMYINAAGNQIGGPIPPDISNLYQLNYLNLENNMLTGSLPASMVNLIELQTLRLYGNSLSGIIPTIPRLVTGSFGGPNNVWQCPIPTGAAYASAFCVSAARTALLQFYQFTGGNLSWTVHTNWGVGDPCAVGWYGVTCALVNGVMMPTQISLRNNGLTGGLPGVLGSLTTLLSINLNGNHLSGGIPPTFAGLDSLVFLDLGNNRLTTGLNVLGQMASLQTIYINNNQLMGTLSFLPQLRTLTYLNAANNQIGGIIPSDIQYLYQLTYFNVENNTLSGALPAVMSNLIELQTLRLYGNSLTGLIPAVPRLSFGSFGGALNVFQCPVPAGTAFATARCTYCQPGYMVTSGQCTPCSPGYYGSGTGACQPCGGDQVAIVPGSVQCAACAPGTYASGGTTCLSALELAQLIILIGVASGILLVLVYQCCAQRTIRARLDDRQLQTSLLTSGGSGI